MQICSQTKVTRESPWASHLSSGGQSRTHTSLERLGQWKCLVAELKDGDRAFEEEDRSCLVMGFQTNTGEHADKLKLFVVSKVVIIVQCFASQKWPRCVQTSSSMSNSGMHINRQEMDTWDAQKYKSFKQKHRSWAYYTKLQTFKQHAKTYKLYGRQWVQTQRNTVVFTVTDNFSSPWTFWC